MEYTDWLARVEELLVEEHNEIYGKALAAHGEFDEENNLESMRGDEPEETYDAGDTPEEYVSFLVEEWELFGPEGE